MTNVLESIRVQIYERLSSPLFGSFVISWAGWNYRFLFVLLLSSLPVEKRFDFIDAHLYTSWGEPWNTCVIKPALTAILFILLYPRVSKFFYREWLQKQVETKELRDEIEKATLLTREESHAIQMRMIKLRDEYEEMIKTQADEIDALRKSQKTDTRIEDSIKVQASETAALNAKIAELTNRVSETQQSNPLFLNVIRFITDDKKATAFKPLIEHTVGLVDKSVSIIIQERTFKDFINRTGYKLLISDELDFKEFISMSPGQVLYASSFGVPDMNNPGSTTMAHYIICKDQTIHMNSSAVSYYDWAYHSLKMEIGMVPDTEADKATSEVFEFHPDREGRPILEIKLDSPENMRLIPGGPSGQIIVVVKNTSRLATVKNVELFVDSIAPPAATQTKLPSQVAMPLARQEAVSYMADRITPVDSKQFAVINYQANTFSLNVKNSHGHVVDIATFGTVSFNLRVTGDDVLPAVAVLNLTGSLTEMQVTMSYAKNPG